MLTSGSSPTTEGLGDGLSTLWFTKRCGWWRRGRGLEGVVEGCGRVVVEGVVEMVVVEGVRVVER